MSVNAMPASAQFEPEIHIHSDDRPMSQDAEPNAGPDAEPDAKSNIRQLTHSPSGRELRAWISESEWTDYLRDDSHVHRELTSMSIFRVPEFMKNTKKEAYVPQRVSLGPYHHRIAKLSPMGHYKGKALCRMMKGYNMNTGFYSDSDNDSDNINMDFANLVKKEILNLEKEIRYSYHEIVDCDGETLSLILSLDGCFLLQVLGNLAGNINNNSLEAMNMLTLCRQMENEFDEMNDEYFNALMVQSKENLIIGVALRDIVNDILMLENQVPFIVLRKLVELVFNLTGDDVNNKLSKMVMACLWRFLKPHCTFHIEQWCDEKLAGEEEVHHLLGFLYEAIVLIGFGPIEDTDRRGPVCSICIDCLGRCIRQHQDRLNEAPIQFQRIHPAVKLRNAGIKFKPSHGGIKEIKFDRKSATIFLPPICITDITEVLFRNLIAFEVCRPFQVTYVSCYVNIMDNLIDSQEDVALLRRMGVLTNRLGRDNEVVDLFNGLNKATGPENLFDVFHRLTVGVNAHYEKEIRVQLQLPKLVQDYCSTPWKALASAAAIVLLLLTLLQTIFSGMTVHK